MKRQVSIPVTLALAIGLAGVPALAQEQGVSGEPIVIPAEFESPEALTADTPVDTAAFAGEAPWKLCVSAGYLFNSWVAFALQNIRYEASLEPNYEPDIVVTDAGFDANKQISDIGDLINQGCEAIIYWPVDDQAVEPGLEQAVAAGIPTVNVGGGYADLPGIVSNAHIDQYQLGVATAVALAEALEGSGKIVSMMPIAGTTAAVNQDQALRDVLAAGYPDIEILDVQNGDEVSLADRKKMEFDLILGRTALRSRRVLVNPGSSFVMGRPLNKLSAGGTADHSPQDKTRPPNGDYLFQQRRKP